MYYVGVSTLAFHMSCFSATPASQILEFFAVGSRVRKPEFLHDQLSDNGKPNIYNRATHSGSLCLLALSVIKLAFIPLFLYCNAAPSNRHMTHVSFAHEKVKLGRAIFKILPSRSLDHRVWHGPLIWINFDI